MPFSANSFNQSKENYLYIDTRKQNYDHILEEAEKNKRISRDKNFAKEVYLKWFQSNSESIVNRLWKITDIGAIEKTGEFVKLLKEAEFTYSLGAFQSSIALVGVSAEDLCRFFATASNNNLDNLSQHDRINRLISLGLITSNAGDDFHAIRKLRNDCLHFNAGFKTKSKLDLQEDALIAINKLKLLYASLVGVIDYNKIDVATLLNIEEAILKEAATGESDNIINSEDATIRLRNLFSNVFGIDISVNHGNQIVTADSLYRIDEIDLETDPPEVSLLDLRRNLPFIVDLTDKDISDFGEVKLKEGDNIFAAIYSITNGLGMTETWKFLSKPEQFG